VVGLLAEIKRRKYMTKKILRVDSSMRKNGSYSRKLVDRLIVQLNKKEQYTTKIRDLSDGVPFINEQWITANFTPVNERMSAQHDELLQSDTLVRELQEADVIVIGLAIYNFSVPAAFKAWIDQVVRSKVTFHYTENGPEGLLENKKAYVVIASGGTKVDSDIDFFSAHVRYILSFIGISDVTFIDSSGIGQDETKVLACANEAIAAI
jgi:FMN-dependent NADH-azoreductase